MVQYFFLFLRIARCTLRLTGPIPRASELYLITAVQAGNRKKISQQILSKYQSPYTKITELISTL